MQNSLCSCRSACCHPLPQSASGDMLRMRQVGGYPMAASSAHPVSGAVGWEKQRESRGQAGRVGWQEGAELSSALLHVRDARAA